MKVRSLVVLVGLCTVSVAIAAWYNSQGSAPPEQKPAPESVFCGPDSLVMALGRLGVGMPPGSLRNKVQLTESGTTFDELERVAKEWPVETKLKKSSWGELREFDGVCILYVGQSHFVAVDPRQVAEHPNEVRVHDPNRVAEWMDRQKLEAIWSGEALLLKRVNEQRQGPVATTTATWHDYGFCFSSLGEAAYQVPITNTGTEELTLEVASVSCNCTRPSLAVSKLQPGETVDCDIHVKLAGKRGQYFEYVTLRTNDAQQPELLITLTGGVYLDDLLSTNSLFLGEVDQGGKLVEYVIAHDPGSNALQVTGTHIKLADPSLEKYLAIDCRVIPIAGATKAPPRANSTRHPIQKGDVVVEVNVQVQRDAPLGKFNGLLEVQTAFDDHLSKLPVAIEGVVKSDFVSTPKAVLLANSGTGKSAVVLKLKRRSSEPFQIVRVGVSDGLPVTVTRLQDNQNSAEIEVRCNFDELPEAQLDGEITIEIQDHMKCTVPVVIRAVGGQRN